MASLVCAWLSLTEEEEEGEGGGAGGEGDEGAPGQGRAGAPPGKKQRLDEAFYLRVGAESQPYSARCAAWAGRWW